jgi:hypothetical protein
VDSAVYNFTASVFEAINEAIPFKNPRFLPSLIGFQNLLYTTSRKNQIFKKYKKSKSDYFYSIFSYYRKLIKINIKADRLDWIGSIDNNLKTHPQHVWKYISKFKRNEICYEN